MILIQTILCKLSIERKSILLLDEFNFDLL